MMDLSNFKLLKEDNSSYHVEHPSGKTMMIDKKGMSDRAHELVKKMAQGGSVMGEQLSHNPNPKIAQVHIKDRFSNNIHKYADGGEIKGDETPVSASKLEAQYAPEEEAAQSKSEPSQAPIINNHYYMSPTPPPAQAAPPVQQAPAPQQADANAQPTVPVAQDQASQQQPDQTQQSQPAQVPPSTGPQGSTQQFQGAEKAQEQDIAGMGQVQSEEQQRNSQAFDQMQKAHQEIANQMEQTGAEYHQNFENVANQVASGTVDPNRWWSQKSTGSKIATAIGMLLGGAGAGVSGHPDMPMKIIGAAVDRDIESQKFDMTNKQNLLGQYTNQYRSSLLGQQALSLQYGAVIEGMLKRSAALSGSQSAKLAADNSIQQLRQGLAPNLENVTKASVMTKMFGDMGKGSGGQAGSEEDFNNKMHQMQIIAPDRFKDMQEKYIPSVGISKVPLDKDDRSSIKNYESLGSDLNKALALQRSFGGSGAWAPKARQDARSAKDSLSVSLNELYGLKRLNDNEYKNYSDQIGNIGGVNMGTTLKGLENLRDNLMRKKTVAYKQLGITPFAQSQNSVAQGGGQDSQAIAWAKNPANAGPKSDAILRANGIK